MRIRVGGIASVLFALTLATASSLAAQAAAATICKDGTTSSASGQGACSGHGGVDTKATEAAKKGATKAEKTASKAAAATEKTTGKAAAATEKTEKSTEKAANATAKSAEKGTEKTAAKAAKAESSTAKAVSKAQKSETKAVEKTAGEPKTKTPSTKSADNNDPTDATAQCKDGTYSHAKNHQGACSNHGGVAKFLK